MSEIRMAQQMDGGTIVRTSRDEAYHLLDRNLKRRVKRGDQVIIQLSGETQVVDRERLRAQSSGEREVPEVATVAAGTFPWITEDVEVPASTVRLGKRMIRIVDISETDGGVLTGLRKRLNGSTPRTETLIRSSLGEALTHSGIIKGAQIFRPRQEGLLGPIFGVTSNGPNETRRVSALITQPTDSSNDAYVVSRSSQVDYQRAIKAIQTVGW